MESVRSWAQSQGFDYRFIDDTIFKPLPADFKKRFAGRGPVLSDLARLLAIQQLHASDYQYVIWVDADLLVFEPEALLVYGSSVKLAGAETSSEVHARQTKIVDCAFGLETWIDLDTRKRLRAWRNVHNAFMVFERHSVVLPYLIHTITSISRRIDPLAVAPQTFGPKLLGALHNITGFNLLTAVGAFSPPVIKDIVTGHGPYLDKLLTSQPSVPAAANLCASLATNPVMMQAACNRLLRDGLGETGKYTY